MGTLENQMLKILLFTVLVNAKRIDKWKCATCKENSNQSSCIPADKPDRCQYGCFIMQNTGNITVNMGCITAGNPIIDLETFDYKNKRWNHQFLKCGTDNLCLFCRSKESVCNKQPSANLMEWKNANQQQSTPPNTTTKATRLATAMTSTTTVKLMATKSVTTSILTTLEVTLANTTLQPNSTINGTNSGAMEFTAPLSFMLLLT